MTAAVAPVPTWAARVVYVGAGIFGLLNLALSSVSIGTLAYTHLHLDIYRSVALGLTPDAGVAVAGTLWVSCTGHLRTWGRNVSLGLVGGSVVANAADVMAAAGLLGARVLVPLAVALTVAGPILALVMGHLVLLVKAAAARPVAPPASLPVAPVEAVDDSPVALPVAAVDPVTEPLPVAPAAAVDRLPVAVAEAVPVAPEDPRPVDDETPTGRHAVAPTGSRPVTPVDDADRTPTGGGGSPVDVLEQATEWATGNEPPPGWRKVQAEFPDLSQTQARRVATAVKQKPTGRPLRAVAGS